MAPTTSTPAPGANEHLQLARETSAYLTNAARSTTAANILAPLLCAALFWQEADPIRFGIWLCYMVIATIVRTWRANRLETEPSRIADPVANLRTTTWCVGLIGFGWGLGWVLVTPDLGLVNRLIYLFITTGAMYSGMFGYGVYRPAFYSLCIPIFVPAIGTAFWPEHGFPWAFSLGIATLFIYVLSISRKFARTYEESIALRLRNEALYQELVSERDASVAANIAKSRFIASASHDLRQPMHAVNFYLESLDPDQIPAPSRTVIAKIRSSVSNLNQMFESLLDISRLDAFSFQPVDESFEIQGLARALEEVGAPLAAAQGIALEVQAPRAWARGDEKLLQQVLLNLVTNAIYYTARGQVQVRFFTHEGCLAVEVRDTGCGIRQEDLSLIFTEFYRVDATRGRHEGLGLGLSIVKRLCDLIRARIDVDSTPGEGSVFRVVTAWPISQGHPAGSGLPAPAATRADVLAGRTIAIVEDDTNITEAYRQVLAQRGARVVVLSEQGAALERELAEIDALDFIISDYRLKHTTGDVVITRLRESFNRDIPAIIVTADTSPAHIALFKALSIPVLHKPISFQRVMQEVERMMNPSAVPQQEA